MKHRVWKLAAAVVLTLAVTVGEFAGIASAATKDEKWANKAASIAAATGTETVRTVYWKTKVTRNVKAKVVRNNKNTADKKIGKKVKIKSGTTVTVIQRDYHEKAGVSQCMLKNGRQVYIKNTYLSFKSPLCTGKNGDYSEATKLAYVNKQTIKSNTNYLIWISLDKQRVNVFTGSNRNWKLLYAWKTSTGKADAPTLDQSFKKKYVVQWKKPVVVGLKYYTAFYGSGIHKFPGSGMSKVIGIKPVSHSCVRILEKNAKWLYDNIPLKTRVWVW